MQWADFMSSQHMALANDQNPNLILVGQPSQICLDSPKEQRMPGSVLSDQLIPQSHNDFPNRGSQQLDSHIIPNSSCDAFVKKAAQGKKKKNFEKFNVRNYSLAFPRSQRRFSIGELKVSHQQSENMLFRIKIRHILKQYVEKLKNYTLQRGTDQLLVQHHDLINDMADSHCVVHYCEVERHKEEKKKFVSHSQKMRILSRSISQKTIGIIQKIERFSRLKERLLDFPTFKESSSFLVFWNFVMLATIIYNFIAMPLRTIFQKEFFGSECLIKPLILMQLVIFILDVLIQCNTIIIIQDEIIYNRKRIFMAYIKSRRAVIDALSLCGFTLAIRPFFHSECNLQQSNIEIFFTSLFFAKYLKLSKLYKKLEQQFTIHQSYLTLIKLFRLMLQFLTIAHYVACLWILAGLYGKARRLNNWIDHFAQEGWYYQYIYALYFSFMTMSTVGYGDITAQNELERVVNMLMMVLACGAFGYIINKISVILDEFEDLKNQYHKELNVVNKYMEKLNIQQELRMKIRNYLKMFWRTNLIQQFSEEDRVVSKLCRSLRDELTIDHLGEILRQIPIFRGTFSSAFLSQLSLRMRQYTLSPDEIVLAPDDEKAGEPRLLVVGLGQAKLLLRGGEGGRLVQCDTLEQGDYYGVRSIFQLNDHVNKHLTIIASQFSLLYELPKSEFHSLLIQYPEDYERYCEIRDCSDFKEQSELINGRCIICKAKTHIFLHCQKVHFAPNRKYTIYKSLFSIQNDRSTQPRRVNRKLKRFPQLKLSQKGKINSLANLALFQQEGHIFKNQNDDSSHSSWQPSFQSPHPSDTDDSHAAKSPPKPTEPKIMVQEEVPPPRPNNFGFIEDEVDQPSSKKMSATKTVTFKHKRSAQRSSTFLKRSGDSNFSKNLENLMENLEGKEKVMHLNPGGEQQHQQQQHHQQQHQQAMKLSRSAIKPAESLERVPMNSPQMMFSMFNVASSKNLDIDQIYQGNIYQPQHQIQVVANVINKRSYFNKRKNKKKITQHTKK